jgi:hypothetical protein
MLAEPIKKKTLFTTLMSSLTLRSKLLYCIVLDFVDDFLSRMPMMTIRHDGVPEQLQLLCILSLGLILVFLFYRLFNSSQVDNEVLEALLTVINPTRSFWPADVMKVAASVRKNKIIRISLRQLYLHLLSGALEFRNPSVDLVQILKEGEYRINGWTVQITVDVSWWSSISIWILRSFIGIMKVSISKCSSY